MSQITDARLQLTPTDQAILDQLAAIPNRPDATWFLTKFSGVLQLGQVATTLATPVNGLQSIGTDIGLGGLMIQNTVIDGDSLYDLGFVDFDSFNVAANTINLGAVASLRATSSITTIGTSDSTSGELRIITLGILDSNVFTGQALQLSNTSTGLVEFGNIDAIYVNYDNAISGLSSTDVQGAIDELSGFLTSSNLVLASGTDTTPGSLIDKLVAGTNISFTLNNSGGNETITIDASTGSSFYQTIQNNGVSITQRTILNLSTLLLATDSGGKTVLTVNQPNLTHNSIGGTLGVSKGGTNITSYTVGDLIYASGTTTLSKLAGVATGNVLLSGGVGTAPSWGKVGLTTHVTGVLPVANGGDSFTVKATGADSTPSDLDDKIEIVSSDGSITVTPTIQNPGLNEKISYNISTVVSGLSEQILGGLAPSGSGDDTDVIACTSSLDGSVVIVACQNASSQVVIYRFEKDLGTGFYKLTNEASVSGVSSGAFGIVIEGSYVYTLFDDGGNNLGCTRFDVADLNNSTVMTVPTIATVGSNFASFSDGAGNIYTNFTSTTYQELVISGTTLTAGSTITGGLANTRGAYFDGTNVFMIDVAGTVDSYTYTVGGSFTLVDTSTFMQAGLLFTDTKYVGITNISATKFHICYSSQIRSYTGSQNQTKEIAIIKPFTKPI